MDSKQFTEWRNFEDHGWNYSTRLEFGWSQHGEQDPYFAVTHHTKRGHDGRGPDDSFGAGVDFERFPEFKNAARWHLVAKSGTPMHYVANACYWAEYVAGCSSFKRKDYDPDATVAFKSTVVFGALEDDVMPSLAYPYPEGHDADCEPALPEEHRAHVKAVVTAWCLARLPRLLEVMKKDLADIGVTY